MAAIKLWSCPWDIPRWRMSRTRTRLTAEARGILRELWDECFAEGTIPDDPMECARLAAVTEEEMNRNWPILRPLFRLRRGRLYHAAASQVRNSVSKKYENVRVRGQLGGSETARRMRELRSTASSTASSIATARASVSVYSDVSSSGFSKGKTSLQRQNLLCAREAANGALADACKTLVWDRYPGVKTDDDLRLVLSLCETTTKVEAMAASLTGWLTSGRWAEPQFTPKMRNWLPNGKHGGECWMVPPALPPAKAKGDVAEQIRQWGTAKGSS